jgi:ACS family hexuronate transporter-like MFS transporter
MLPTTKRLEMAMPPTAGNTRFRYTIFMLMVLIMLINYIDRGALSYAASFVTGEYKLGKQSWGAVLGYFGYGYMFGALLGGVMADRLGPRRVWLIAGVSWSIFEMSTAYAGDLGLALMGGSALAGFAVIRVLFGFAEGPSYSNINKTMSTWATQKERGFAISIGLLSTPLGALLTAPVSVGLLMLTGSWRTMFIVLGVACLVALLVFMRMFTDRPDTNPRVGAAELAAIQADRPAVASAADTRAAYPWWAFFTSRTLVLNSVGYFAFQYVNFMLLTWTPKYLQDQFHFNLSSLWYLGMIPWVGACFTVLLGGRLSDWLLKRTGKLTIARSRFAAVSLLSTTICFLLISRASDPVTVIALMTLGNALNSLPNSVFWAVIIDTAPQRTGTYSGMTAFIVNTGAVLAPTLSGYLSARYGYASMFLATGAVTAIGMLAMLLVRPGVGPRPRVAVSIPAQTAV